MYAGISYIYISTSAFSFDHWIHISKCLLITSTWMSQWNYNLTMSKTKFQFLHNSAPFPVFSFSVNGSTFLPFLQSRIVQPILNTFISLLIHNKSVNKFCLFYHFNVSLTTCLHPNYHPGPNCHDFSPAFTPAMVPCLPKSHLILSNLFFTLQSMCPYVGHWNDFSLL